MVAILGVLAALAAWGAIAAWGIRQDQKRRWERAMRGAVATLRPQLRALLEVIGAALIPAVRAANESLVAFAEASAGVDGEATRRPENEKETP